jgi:TP901 family phage tail tape measure protein
MAISIPLVTTFDSKGITRAIQQFKKLDGSVAKSGFAIRNLNQASNNAFKKIAKVGGVLGVGLGLAVKAFAGFDSAMNQSTAIMGNVSDEMKNKMAQAARQMAKETTFSATQAAESFYFLASAGLNAEQSIGALPKVAKFAQAGMFDMATATTLLADSQSALGLRSADTATNMQNLVRVSDVLVQANILANASVQQFAESLTNKAGASMKALNIPLEQGVAVLAQFAASGTKGSEAGTQFNAVLRGLTGGVQDAPEKWKKLNIEVYNSAGALNNLGDIVGMMEVALNGMTVEQQRNTLAGLGFEERTLSAMQALLGNSEAIKKYETDLKSAGGVTETVASKQLESLSSQLTLAKNAFVDLAIQLGEKVAPVVETVTEFLRQFADIVGEEGLGAGLDFTATKALNFIENLDGMGAIVFYVTSMMVALKVAMVAFTVAETVATVAVKAFNLSWNATGIGLVISAIVLIIATLVILTLKFKGFKTFFINLWNGIIDYFQTSINIFLGIWEWLINKIIDGVNLIIRSWNRVQWGTDVSEIDEVSFAFDILGAKIDRATEKVKYFQRTMNADTYERQNPVSPFVPPLPTLTPSGSGSGSKELTAEEKRLQELIDKVKELKEQMQDYRKGLRDAFNIKLSSDTSNGSALTQTRNTLREIKEFRSNIKRLQARGVGSAILQEVADAGLFGGNSLAKDILNMSDLDFREFRSGQAEIAKIAGETAGLVSQKVFGTKVADAENNVLLASIDWDEFGKWLDSQPKAQASNITVNMPAGSNGDDVVKALQNYNRRKGAIPISVNSDRTV